MSLPPTVEGCIVEAGTYKGGGAAKLSIIAKLLGRRLIIFDSFEGLPQNEEKHDKSILGHSIQDWFKQGNFLGTLDEVRHTVETYGEIRVCTFKEGWFENTMPIFKEKICALYVDCDLAASTKTTLKWLYPLVVPGGIVFSQDGDFPLVIDVFNDDEFWQTQVGCQKPHITGLGLKKLISIEKPLNAMGA
jgi:O-methyltransferase